MKETKRVRIPVDGDSLRHVTAARFAPIRNPHLVTLMSMVVALVAIVTVAWASAAGLAITVEQRVYTPVNILSTSIGKRTYKYAPQSVPMSYVTNRYPALASMMRQGTQPVPGLEQTAQAGANQCTSMVPQGIAADDKYILITAYCPHTSAAVTTSGHPTDYQDSVIYVLSRTTKQPLCTLTFAHWQSDHVGGITAVPTQFGSMYFITTGEKKGTDDHFMELTLTEKDIDVYVNSARQSGKTMPTFDIESALSGNFVSLPYHEGLSSASFNTTDENGNLWVGGFSKHGPNVLAGYSVSFASQDAYNVGKPTLRYLYSYRIPTKAQGAAFANLSSGRKLLVTQSYDRKSLCSTLFALDANHPGSGMKEMSVGGTQAIELPPMLEEVAVQGDSIFTVYESGSRLYSEASETNRCRIPVDEFCVTSMNAPSWSALQALINMPTYTWTNWTLLRIRCPVNVRVYDSDGNLVGSVVNGVTDSDPFDRTVLISTDGEEKTVAISDEDDYRIEIEATSNGTMDVVCDEVCDGRIAERRLYDDVALTTGQQFDLDVDGEMEQEDTLTERTTLLTNTGEIAADSERNYGEDGVFSDVFLDTPHADDVLWLSDNSVSTGFPDRTFRPYSETKRCDMAAFLFRMATRWGLVDKSWQPSTSQRNAFSDVTVSTPHATEIWWLASTGITQGWSVGNHKEFRPYENVTRQDMAAFLFRLAKLAGKGGASDSWKASDEAKSRFQDVDANQEDNHHNEVWWLAETGVSEGWDMKNGKWEFRGLNDIARCDMAAFLHRMDGLS